MFRPILFFLALLPVTLAASLAQATDYAGSLENEVAKAAEKIVKTLKSADKATLLLGEIVPRGTNKMNGGPGLKLALRKALEKLKPGVVQEDSDVVLLGEFGPVDDDKDKVDHNTQDDPPREMDLVSLRIKAQRKTLDEVEFEITRISDRAGLEGSNAHIDPSADSRKQNNQFREARKQPEASVSENTFVRSKKDSPYSLQVGVKKMSAGVKAPVSIRPVTLDKGIPFVNIQQEELYELVIHNDSDQEIGVSIKIDGIDVFAFSDDRDPATGKPKFTHYIVAPKSKFVLPGWHKTNDPKRDDNFLSFLVTEYGKGASSKLGSKAFGEIGVITVAISQSIPSDLPGKGGSETGFGPPVKGDLKEVKRTIEPATDFITVRYLRN